jgi:hypothetical protein
MSKVKIITLINVIASFNTVRIAKGDKEKTAF